MDKLWRFIRSERGREFVFYVAVGILTTLINIAVFQLVNAAMGIDYKVANVIAWVVAVLFAFAANKIYVFRSRSWKPGLALKEAASFTAARLLSLLMDMGLIMAMVEWLRMPEFIAKLISNVAVVILNYVLSKLVIFRKRGS